VNSDLLSWFLAVGRKCQHPILGQVPNHASRICGRQLMWSLSSSKGRASTSAVLSLSKGSARSHIGFQGEPVGSRD
jgi:hypothetical protein